MHLGGPFRCRSTGAARAAVQKVWCVSVPRLMRETLHCRNEYGPRSCVLFTCLLRRQRPCVAHAADNSASVVLPKPVIKIDNSTDPFATVVKVEFGDRLGELLDTIQGLKNMGYNISRAKLNEGAKNKFYITNAKTSEKVYKSAELEAIRMCILTTMVEYHPEAEPLVATGATAENPNTPHALGAQFHEEVATSIRLHTPPDSAFTKLEVTTVDRPGLLVEIVRTLKDCNVNVVSAEVDTIGSLAKDEFMLAYHGGPLPKPMRTLVRNALGYYLALAEIETAESY